MLAAIAFIVFAESFNKVAAIMAFYFTANYAVAYAAVFVLRRREPDSERPYRAWGYPWSTGIALLLGVLFLTGAFYSDITGGLAACCKRYTLDSVELHSRPRCQLSALSSFRLEEEDPAL